MLYQFERRVGKALRRQKRVKQDDKRKAGSVIEWKLDRKGLKKIQ